MPGVCREGWIWSCAWKNIKPMVTALLSLSSWSFLCLLLLCTVISPLPTTHWNHLSLHPNFMILPQSLHISVLWQKAKNKKGTAIDLHMALCIVYQTGLDQSIPFPQVASKIKKSRKKENKMPKKTFLVASFNPNFVLQSIFVFPLFFKEVRNNIMPLKKKYY